MAVALSPTSRESPYACGLMAHANSDLSDLTDVAVYDLTISSQSFYGKFSQLLCMFDKEEFRVRSSSDADNAIAPTAACVRKPAARAIAFSHLSECIRHLAWRRVQNPSSASPERISRGG